MALQTARSPFIALVVLTLTPVASAYAVPCSGVAAWSGTGVSYSPNNQVTFGGSRYHCITTHRSQADWTPTAAASLWSADGTCDAGGSTPTPTTPARSTPTPTSVARVTPTAPPSGAGCWSGWGSGTQYNSGAQVSRTCGGVTENFQAAFWTQGNDPCSSRNVGGNGLQWFPRGTCGGSATPVPTTPPGGGTGIGSIVSGAQFDQAFPPGGRNGFYTYQGFVDGASAIAAFCGAGDTAMKQRECASALANFYHETGGLYYVTEINKSVYCDAGQSGGCACAPGQSYYGRGPIQLSWNFNYCAASQWLFGSGNFTLVTNPSQVEQSSAIAWKAAIWYWMTQRGPATRPAHDAVIGNFGFGETIRAINGSIECNGGNPAQVQSRIDQFNRMRGILGNVAAVGPSGC